MKPSVNLLPLMYRRRLLVRRSLMRWSRIGAVCLAVLCAAGWLTWKRNQSVAEAVATAERNAAPVKQLVVEQTSIRAALHALDEKGTVLGQVRSQRPLLSLVAAVSASARRCEGRLVVQHLLFDRKEEQPAAAAAPSPIAGAPATAEPPKPTPVANDPWGSVIIRGDAVDNLAVATFVVGLRESGLFRSVELKSCLRAPTGGRQIRTYLLQCDL